MDRWGRIRGVVIGKQVPLSQKQNCQNLFQTYRTGDMAWWEQIADFWWGEGWEEWMVFPSNAIHIFWKSTNVTKQVLFHNTIIIR